jgi:hypothetical protein
MTARPMEQLDRHTDGTGHPAIAPLDHRDDQRIEIDPFLRQAIFKPTRTLFVLDADQDSIAYQLPQAIGQAMRRQAQISLHLFVSKGLVGVELRRIQRDTRF